MYSSNSYRRNPCKYKEHELHVVSSLPISNGRHLLIVTKENTLLIDNIVNYFLFMLSTIGEIIARRRIILARISQIAACV